ncbi:MAG: DUF4383 domain-containing protein [Pseudomonadota bacterium]|nr:DUF4383 domain-containing protein [Pseudomonadota bacterium]
MIDLESTEFERKYTRVIGVLLIAAGLLGFVFGDRLFGITVSGLHNTAHLGAGLAALLCAAVAGGKYAFRFNQIVGLSFVGLGVLGFLGLEPFTQLLHLNPAGNWFHTLLGAVTLIIGIGIELPHKYTPEWWQT